MKKRSIELSTLKLNKDSIASLQHTILGGQEQKHKETAQGYDTKLQCRSVLTEVTCPTTSCIACPMPGSATD
ncbi:hypothetical protein [uncultured Kordia sp.]|uniref:hypothetical protein n=1 Tax=uncultured Kordia sp. TaxID=507699 RepID=UPI00260C1C68|nr:hypothetical protein [uncultured Kordia sp.]